MRIFKLPVAVSFFGFLMLLFACQKPPETFEMAMEKYQIGDYENAITLFKLTPVEEKTWYDSSISMIRTSIGNVLSKRDLEEITSLCRINEDDSLVQPIIISEIKKSWNSNMKKNPVYNFSLYDSLSFIMSNDPQTPKLLRKNEDSFFRGIWRCPRGSIKGKEIYFERNEKTKYVDAKSNKSGQGWDKGKVMYGDIFYMGNMVLDHKVRVFRSTYFGSSESMTRSKGKMTIVSEDSLLVDYEGSVSSNNRVYFIRSEN
ncbi:MAG: hypothetical protein ACKOA1_07485 [Bacteroidota bacterium]